MRISREACSGEDVPDEVLTGGRPERAYLFQEEQAYIVISQSRSPLAAPLTRQMAMLFEAWRRGQLHLHHGGGPPANDARPVHVERLIEVAVAPLRKELAEVKEALRRPVQLSLLPGGPAAKDRPWWTPSPGRQAEIEGYILEAIRQSPGITANEAVRLARVQRNAGLTAVRALLAKGMLVRRRDRLHTAG